MDTLTFISRYEAILKAKKIAKMQFYKDCDITDAAVSQWRKQKTKPAMTTISRIADYLNVSVGYLLGTEQNEKSPASEDAELSLAKIQLIEKIKKMDDSLIEILNNLADEVLSAQGK